MMADDVTKKEEKSKWKKFSCVYEHERYWIEMRVWVGTVHKGVCSIKHEQWFIYVFFRRPSAPLYTKRPAGAHTYSHVASDMDELMKHENKGTKRILNIKKKL